MVILIRKADAICKERCYTYKTLNNPETFENHAVERWQKTSKIKYSVVF